MSGYIDYNTLPWETHDELLLPDGTPANDLRLVALRAELNRLCVPEITPEMGKHVLLEKYQAFVDARGQQDKERFMRELKETDG